MTGAEVFTGETWDGDTMVSVLPTIPDDAPEEIREGIARRRISVITGRCPCGAQMVLPNRADRRAAKRAGRTLHFAVEHEDGCPAIDAVLLDAVRRWKR